MIIKFKKIISIWIMTSLVFTNVMFGFAKNQEVDFNESKIEMISDDSDIIEEINYDKQNIEKNDIYKLEEIEENENITEEEFEDNKNQDNEELNNIDEKIDIEEKIEIIDDEIDIIEEDIIIDKEILSKENVASQSDVDIEILESVDDTLVENENIILKTELKTLYATGIYTLDDFIPNKINDITKLTIRKGGSVPNGEPVRILSTVSNAGLYRVDNEYTVYAGTSETIKLGKGDQFKQWFSLSEIVGLGNLDTSETKSLAGMFHSCWSLMKIDFKGFDTSNVEDMSEMFENCGVSELDLSGFDTSNVRTMRSMFDGTSWVKILNLSSFDTSNVTDMSRMFAMTTCLEKVYVNKSMFVINSTTNTSNMFYWTNSPTLNENEVDGNLTEAPKADEAIVVFVYDLVHERSTGYTTHGMQIPKIYSFETKGSIIKNKPQIEFNTKKDMKVLAWCKDSALTMEWDFTKPVTEDMWLYAKWGKKINVVLGDGAKYIVEPSIDMLTIDNTTNIVFPDTSNIVCNGATFDGWYKDESFSSKYDDKTFYDRINGSIYAKWVAEKQIYKVSDFINAELDKNLSGGLNSITNLVFMSSDKAPNANIIYHLDTFGTTGVYQDGNKTIICVNSVDEINLCEGAFKGLTNLNSIENMQLLKTENTTDFSEVFYGCKNLKNIDCSSFNTKNATIMKSMFEGCENLESLDISTFDIEKVTDMSKMFSNCSNLESIYVGKDFVLNSSTNQNNIHDNCPLLKESNYGKFTKKSYTVIFNYNNATFKEADKIINVSYISGEKIEKPENPTRSGYTFTNWYTDKALTNVFNFGIADKDLTLYAGWSINSTKSSKRSSGGGGGGGGGGGALPSTLANDINNNMVTSENPLTTTNVPQQSEAKQIDSKSNEVVLNSNDVVWVYDSIKNSWQLNMNKDNSNEMFTNGFVQILSKDLNNNTNSDVYYFDESGNMYIGWMRDQAGNMYNFDSNPGNDIGKMSIGWKQIGQGFWYYFNNDGKLLTNSITPDGHIVGADGKWTQ